MKKNILITGAKGQLGSEIRNIVENKDDYNFIYTDVKELDITNETEVVNFVENNKIDLIINCAAYTAVDKAEEDKDNAYKVNVIGPKNLTIAAQNRNISIIHTSTDYVFDGKAYKPYLESDKTNPQSVYGNTKLEGEHEVAKYEKHIIIRTAWLYSIFGNNFVKTIIRIANENLQITVVDDQIGSPTNAADLAYACVKIAKDILDEKEIIYGTYHYANQGICSWYDFAKAIVELKNISCNVKAVDSSMFKRPAPRPHYSVLNKSKVINNFNIDIPHWRDSLEKVLNKLN